MSGRLLLATALVTSLGATSAAARDVLVKGFFSPGRIDASPDGRAWMRSGDGKRAVVIGPGDEAVAADTSGPPWQVPSPAAPPGACPNLALGADGTLECDGAHATLDEQLLHAIGPTRIRLKLAPDESSATPRYAILRSERPMSGGRGTDHSWAIAVFTERGVERDIALPDLASTTQSTAARTTPALAIAGRHVWLAFAYGVAHFDGTDWTVFGDQRGWTSYRHVDAKASCDLVLSAGVFTVGTYAFASAWSTPVSLVGRQQFFPTATTSFAGGVPALATVALFSAAATKGTGLGADLVRIGEIFLGVLTIPVVSLGTYATGELAFKGTNASGGYLGALGGTASGALVWALASGFVLGDRAVNDDWWWALPLGASFVGTSSTAGYLWAGRGFVR